MDTNAINVGGLSPILLGALVTQVGVPELVRWLGSLHQQGVTVVTEAQALEKLGLDVDGGNAAARAFLAAHPPDPALF
jgi:hypothetical protein